MKKTFLLAFGYALMIACNSKQPADQQTAPVTTDAKPQATEFADAKYTDIGKAELAAMQSGDMDKWLSMFADNAKYFWNSGDSLIGKAAISDYWKKRRTEVIDSI